MTQPDFTIIQTQGRWNANLLTPEETKHSRSRYKHWRKTKTAKRVMAELLIEQDSKCAYCQVDFATSADRKHSIVDGVECYYQDRAIEDRMPQLDHATPLAKGGLSVKENLQYLCASCNRHKGAR